MPSFLLKQIVTWQTQFSILEWYLSLFPLIFESMKRFGYVLGLFLLLNVGNLLAQAMPPGLPGLSTIWHRDTTLCDYIFVNTVRFQLPQTDASAGMILNKHGELVWYIRSQDNVYDLEPKGNGNLAFNINNEWYQLDSNLISTPYPTCNNTYSDLHELLLLDDGRSFELCIGDTVMDLSSIQTRSGQNGDSLGQVRYTVVVELDSSGTVLNQWRGIDHFDIQDVDPFYFTLPTYLELNHTNSIAYDGRFVLLSHRSNHEISLIDWPTQRMVWRLGGNHNQFLYPRGGVFNSQHDARFVGPNQISLFDNATQATPNNPRAIVFEMDTVTMEADMILEWKSPAANSNSMGGFRQLPNGDGIVTWGNVYPQEHTNITYFNARQQAVADLHWSEPHLSYRAVCADLPFQIEQPTITCEVQNGNLILRLVGNYPSQQWSTGSTDDFIVLADTGWYQCYVPLGDGFVGSNVFHVTDLNAGCPVPVASDDIQESNRVPRLIGLFDILGRKVAHPEMGELYIERYDNGLSRKVMYRN